MNKKIILSSFIIFLMVTSIAGFIFAPEENQFEEKKNYKDIEFVKKGERWFTTVNNNEYSILIDPNTLSEQNIISLNNFKTAQKIYVSVDPRQQLGRILPELNYFLSFLNNKIVSSCSLDIAECKSLPIRTCKDATAFNKVILIN